MDDVEYVVPASVIVSADWLDKASLEAIGAGEHDDLGSPALMATVMFEYVTAGPPRRSLKWCSLKLTYHKKS